jgi:hypothetical protein
VSFSVSVHRTPDEILFFAPVAGDGDLRQFWSVPASQLDLPLLAQIYDEGLQLSGADLGRLHDEVWTLQKLWIEIISDDEIRQSDAEATPGGWALRWTRTPTRKIEVR